MVQQKNAAKVERQQRAAQEKKAAKRAKVERAK